ncbi:swi5-dependent recombination DNA repair protein 1 homolog [Mercenaria mercenaria]|uniref:swi5-dependent recombination DNA repair protein 1 homolog n=1 Tax=Mercenaria mercenaria TaxID=6596 RepID=UPI00234EC6F6|nr:swi5-dependent recombination DNA repair protein 1 homolog [Mercenaria mercenaria]
MNKTSTPPIVKSQLSSSLKERLKKCGRYHASPEPVAREPKIPVGAPTEERKQTDLIEKSASFSPQIKRQCMTDQSGTLHRGYKEFTDCHSNKTSSLVSVSTLSHQPSSLHVEKTKLDEKAAKCNASNSSLNQTPLTQRSRSSASRAKGSKLSFEDANKENDTALEKPRGTSSEQSDRSDLTDLDPSVVSSRSRLLKEVETKEEQLRKLRMVKMYRSKNNLEELQILIDKWRAVSQQAVQDLHAAMPEPRPSLTELINHLGIDHELLHFSAEDDETFF